MKCCLEAHKQTEWSSRNENYDAMLRMQSIDRRNFENYRHELRKDIPVRKLQRFDELSRQIRKIMRNNHKQLRKDCLIDGDLYYQERYSNYLIDTNFMFNAYKHQLFD